MMKYCIECGKMVLWLDEPWGQSGDGFHVVGMWPDQFFCSGPFASTCPPELSEGWQDVVQEPSKFELEAMDAHAQELLEEISIR